MKIGILTDSSAYLTKEQQAKYKIKVLPIPIIWCKHIYHDLVDIGYQEFYQKLAQSKVLPTTSQPSTGELKKAINQYVEANYTDVIIITLSSGISGFYQSVVSFAKQEKRIKLHPFDCKITCAGQADTALLAARLVQQGADLKLIFHDLLDLRSTMNVRFMVDDLNHLKRTGRLSNAASFMGTLLKIKPILSMDVQNKGKIAAIAKERQYRRAYKHIQMDFQKLIKDKSYPLQATIFDARVPNRCTEWLADYQRNFPSVRFKRSIIGPVVGVHTGQGALAIIWCRDLDSYFTPTDKIIPDVNSSRKEWTF